MKIKAGLSESLADMITERIGIMLSGNSDLQPIRLFQRFPSLFSDEEREYIKEKESESMLNAYKAKFVHYAYRHNQMMKERGCTK